ncbi:imidazole glycerol phosphate synthase subunit HisF [Thermoproteus tenax]|uniref:Imidazole glycerol phosphate synthase subunit HisF n=1 Tax=Thermoproteus tenax (strain ATCC 35583 / DSM 2078 / JCM 9277 / NBRC 100435 / Kra 1) TaxID=768679 RepID=G4RPE4_THETK|nr:imidazole glycerol phosphate synthase subunit HisF [Thermoproteus tenax]CCC81439.1 imidazole glycerol phosphate synthase, cyclase subunit F [Thermoproteus tenax Kra 1]
MTAVRIIPCLDIDGRKGVVVKGVNFQGLREVGDPIELAMKYDDEGADELVILDITASIEDRPTFLKVVKEVATSVSIPVTIGGGVRSLEDADKLFKAGADKVSINTAAVKRPQLVEELARQYGSQSTVVAIDAKRIGSRYKVYIKSGGTPTDLDAVVWAVKAADLGAGELLVTSIDKDGTRSGYDIELLRAISSSVTIPIIASGGAGEMRHFYEGALAGAQGLLAASLFHFGIIKIRELKEYLASRGVEVRLDYD